MARLELNLPVLVGTAHFADLMQTIIEEVLRRRKQVRSGHSLNSALNRGLRIDGFSRASLAPVPRLAEAAFHWYSWTLGHPTAAEHEKFPVVALFDAWRELRSPLFDALRAYLVPIAHDPLETDELSTVVTPDELDALLAGFDPPSSVPPAQIRLAACLILGYAVFQPNHFSAIAEPLLKEKVMRTEFVTVVDTLRALDPDDSVWDEIDGLVAAVQTLAEEKIAARSAHLRPLEDAIGAFAQRIDLDFFGLPVPLDWFVPNCTPDDAQRLIDEIKMLAGLMDRYQALDSERVGDRLTFVQKNALATEQQQLVPKIIDLRDRLIEQLSTSAPEPPTPGRELGSDSGAVDSSPVESWTEPPADEEFVLDEPSPLPDDEQTAVPLEIVPELPIDAREKASGDRQPSMKEVSTPEFAAEVPTETTQRTPDPAPVIEPPPLVWTLMAQQDWSGAYWLARSEEELGRGPGSVAADTLAVLIAVADGTPGEPGIGSIIVEYLKSPACESPPSGVAEAALRAAAAVKGTLLYPESGLAVWLQNPEQWDSLNQMVHAVREFTQQTGLTFDPAYLHSLHEHAARDAERERLRQAAQELATNVESYSTGYQPATEVWRRWIRSGELHTMLEAVLNNRATNAKQVLDLCEHWLDPEYFERQLERTDKELRTGKRAGINFAARRQLERDSREVSETVLRWCRFVLNEQQEPNTRSWQIKQATRLKQSLLPALDAVTADLEYADLSRVGVELQAAFHYVRGIVTDLGALFTAPGADSPSDIRTNEPLDWRLRERLIALPALTAKLGNVYTDELHREQFAVLSEELTRLCLQGAGLREIVQRSIELGDFRFIDSILRDADPDEIAALRSQADAARSAMSQELAARRAELELLIESRLVDGVIGDEERAQYLNVVEAVEPSNTLQPGRALQEMEQVRKSLEDARQNRLGALMDSWIALQETPLWNARAEELRQRTTHRITQDFELGDTRVIEERLSAIRNHEVSDDQLGDMLGGDELDSALQDFLDHGRDIENLLQTAKDNANRVLEYSDSLTQFREGGSSQDRARVTRALQAWFDLKREGTSAPYDRYSTNIRTVLEAIGFRVTQNPALERGEQTYLRKFEVRMEAPEESVRPIARFGSQSHRSYGLVCFWERPDSDRWSDLLSKEKLENQSTFILWFGKLSKGKRFQYSERMRERNLPIILIDDLLFVYLMLAYRGRERIRPLMQCSIPFTALNPYSPFVAGSVPPEMFYGRKEMADQLQDKQGPCLVYGGRQLGKSALLNYVVRRFNNGQNRTAWVRDIKQVGEQSAELPTSMLWNYLRDDFKERGLMPSSVRTTNPDEIIKHIRAYFAKNSDARVIVLFDEADNFLDADAQDNFRIVDRLRDLMSVTDRRFKIVFAGLHNVQRFRNIPNQPLAHMGTPIQVGPLDTTSARRLIREPLEVLGYRLAESIVLRILSYTNYHPGLIQYFCSELVREASKRPRTTDGNTYTITERDLNAIYHNPTVRAEIRARFEWTLALDKRYEVIAWAMIFDQLDVHDSYAREYDDQTIFNLARAWWSTGFSSGTIRGLLEEMKGLGILVERHGKFQLRSPNLVRLMGETSVLANLEAVQDTPPIQVGQDHLHAQLGPDGKGHEIYSPFTLTQERALNMEKSSVALVASCELSGAQGVLGALRRMLSSWLGDEQKLFVHLPCVSAPLKNELDRTVAKNPSCREFLVFCELDESNRVGSLHEIVRDATDYVNRARSRTPNIRLRVYIHFRPADVWKWWQLPVEQRAPIVRQTGELQVCQPWSKEGLMKRLENDLGFATIRFANQLIELTGGWHSLLNIAIQQFPRANVGNAQLERIAQELATKHTWLPANCIVRLLH